MSSAASLPSSQPLRPQRVLACVLCQQRKVKCDRKFPCANCIKSRAQCVPATLTPRRRRRVFAERELLERLRKYEDLLRQHSISFEPFGKSPPAHSESPDGHGHADSHEDQPEAMETDYASPSATIKSETVYEPKNFWDAFKIQYRDRDDDSDGSHQEPEVSDVVFRNAWDQLYENNDHLLFGSPSTTVDLSSLHPDPAQIFRLWQIYLDNVDPLLKVTHAPSLQVRIIEAASNLTTITPTLEALMFSIYCMSTLSLAAEDCQPMFGLSREDLLTRFHFGCHQALLNCRFLRTSDRDCLTALYLYLVSTRPITIPQSLSSILGIAMRIAQRMGIHSEAELAKCTPFEAEMRRRLWWALALFDTRVGEMADYKVSTLTPTWDCQIPLNVNDSELRPDMKELPAIQAKSSEALFVVVRSELSDFVRHTSFHLDFTIPALKSVAKDSQHSSAPAGREIDALEEIVENKYLKYCDPENPFHYMTIWTTRAFLAKCRLMEHHSIWYSTSGSQTEEQRDILISHSISALQCNTKLVMSPLLKRYIWLTQFHFPFPSYIQITQDLRRRPTSAYSEQAWEVMGENFEAQDAFRVKVKSPFFKIFAKLILQAWEAREAALSHQSQPLIPPKIVTYVTHKFGHSTQHEQNPNASQFGGSPTNMDTSDLSMATSISFSEGYPLYNMGGIQDDYTIPGIDPYSNMPFQTSLDLDGLGCIGLEFCEYAAV